MCVFNQSNLIKEFSNDIEINIGDYIHTKNDYVVHILDKSLTPLLNWSKEDGNFTTIFYLCNIYDTNYNLICKRTMLTFEAIKLGKLERYMADFSRNPSYIGNIRYTDHFFEFELWNDMISKCYNYQDKAFPFIGALGNIVCDRWLCFEYFYADIRYVEGYDYASENLNKSKYIIDIYDKQKHIHPFNRIYAPGFCRIKKYKDSDVCMYISSNPITKGFPYNHSISQLFRTGALNPETFFNKFSGIYVNLTNRDGIFTNGVPLPYNAFANTDLNMAKTMCNVEG